jgi:transglutaminase-like putative cysteine protease
VTKPPVGWSGVVLVALMMLTVAWSIQIADYAPGLYILTPVVLGGVLAGALLGSMTWLPAALAHGWGVVLGLATTALLSSSALSGYVGQGGLAGQDLAGRLTAVRDWYLAWVSAAHSGAEMSSSLVQFAFVVSMAFLVWLLAYICTWFVTRYVSWWGAALPSGFALVFNLYQAPGEHTLGIAFFLVCALLLAEQAHLALQVERWQFEHIAFGPDVAADFLRDGLVIALVVVGAAWMAPERVSQQTLRQALSQWTGGPDAVQERLNRIFPGPTVPNRGGGTSFPASMDLGGSVSLGQQVIFEARVEGSDTPPRYWRMAVFDRYDGAGWSRTATSTTVVDAADLAWTREYLATTPVTQTARVFQGGATQLPAMPQPAAFDRAVRLEVGPADSPPDVHTVSAVTPLAVGDTYRVVSMVSTADVASLQAASAGDPNWVLDRYLKVPASVPARVGKLASQLTEGTGNRYDAAAALEAYLRTYTYSEEIDTPPEGRDRVDWFLFDERRGYCDYYASAFVIMARSVGIPARLAAGYSTGEYVVETSMFRQHEFDAHTWPEVYFPGYGWIEFEPTGADRPIDRPAGASPHTTAQPKPPTAQPTPAAQPDDSSPAQTDDGAPGQPATPPHSGRWLPLLASLLGLTVAGVTASYVAWQRPLAGLSAAQAAYARLTRVATWLRIGPDPADTPAEYAERLARAVPRGSADIRTIVDAYVRERFGRQDVTGRAAQLAEAWHRLRLDLMAAARRLLVHR